MTEDLYSKLEVLTELSDIKASLESLIYIFDALWDDVLLADRTTIVLRYLSELKAAIDYLEEEH